MNSGPKRLCRKKKSFQKIISEHLDGEYEKLNNKSLLIFGKRDKQTPPYMARKMSKKIKASRLILMRYCGHFCFAENAEKFNGEVFKFLMGNE